jgi:histidine phosphotransfer protein HptB
MKPKMPDFRPVAAYPLLSVIRHSGFRVVPPGWRMEGMMIDWTRVSDLRSEIGDDSFAEVIDLFLEETDEVIARLAKGDSRISVGADLHFLKGSALNLGFSDLAALCQDGERRAATGDAHMVDMGRIVACYQASRQAFEGGLAGRTAA